MNGLDHHRNPERMKYLVETIAISAVIFSWIWRRFA